MLLISSYLTHSQIQPNKKNPDRNVKGKKIQLIRNRGEFLRFNWLKDLRGSCPSCRTGETEFEDFSFNWGNGFHTALNNLVLLERAQVAKLNAWYRRQFNLMKDEIEKQLNTSFNNYNQAKEAFFSDIETRNITKNTPVILSKYERLFNSGKRKNRRYLRELKSLQLREIELRRGNINNSQFPYLEAKGVLLKEITSLNMLSRYKSDIVNAFEKQTVRNIEYMYTIEKLDHLGSSFEHEMVKLKNKYYNSFSNWDKLGLMQFLLNYEHYKDIINCGVCIIPNELYKFKNSDIATQPVIEEYAKNNRNKGLSIFDPRYPQVHRYQYQNNFCGGPINFMAWEADKKAVLDRLLNNVSTSSLVIESLIAELNITDNSQKNWLYSSSNSNEVSNLSDFLQNNRVHGVVAVEAMNFAKEAIEALKDGAEVDYEEKLILDSDLKDNDCLYSVYTEMGKAPTFANYLNNFDEDMSVANLKLTSSTTLPNSTNAQTSAPQNYLITITFNENNLDRPKLCIARTFIHEMIHAEIFRKLLSVAQHPSIQLDQNQLIQLRNDYPGLYDYYTRWKNNVPNGINLTSPQHQVMATHYRGIIIEALKEYDNTKSDEIYEALSWVGLQNTIAWNNLSPNEQTNILQIVATFNSSNTNCQ